MSAMPASAMIASAPVELADVTGEALEPELLKVDGGVAGTASEPLQDAATADGSSSDDEAKSTTASSSSDEHLLYSTEQPIFITTEHWTPTFFLQFLLPNSRYAHLRKEDIAWCDIATGTWEENFAKLSALLRRYGGASRCYACSDPPMELYSAVHESLKSEVELTGASFHAFFVATNKLAARRMLKGAEGVGCEAVTSEMDLLPDLGRAGFFKPLSECGSKGVFKCETGVAIANPVKGTKNAQSINTTVRQLAEGIEELRPYLSDTLVGLVEEYVPPEGRKIVAFDGFVCQGKIYHYAMMDNLYTPDNPEKLDCLVSPSQTLQEGSPEAMAGWALFDSMVGSLVERGLDNQFLDLEAFVLPDGRVEAVELNCRTSCNPLPLFGRVFGAEHDMFSAALDLLAGRRPPCADTVPDSQGRVGVGVYYDREIEGAPDFVESEDGAAVYYGCGPNFPAQVYTVGPEGLAANRARCDEFYAEVQARYRPLHESA